MKRGQAHLPVHRPVELSHVEREIVIMLATGMTQHEIGEALGYARYTMRNRVHHICQRVGVRNAAALVAWALLTGSISGAAVRDLWAQRGTVEDFHR